MLEKHLVLPDEGQGQGATSKFFSYYHNKICPIPQDRHTQTDRLT